MEERRTIRLWVVVAALVLLPVGTYTMGYFGLTHPTKMLFIRYDDGSERMAYRPRLFARQWLATIYTPAGRVEQLLTGVEVRVLADDDEDGPIFPEHRR